MKTSNIKFTQGLIQKAKNNWVLKGEDLSNLSDLEIIKLFCKSSISEDGEDYCEGGLRMEIFEECYNAYK